MSCITSVAKACLVYGYLKIIIHVYLKRNHFLVFFIIVRCWEGMFKKTFIVIFQCFFNVVAIEQPDILS
jgi:hypothetical protein